MGKKTTQPEIQAAPLPSIEDIPADDLEILNHFKRAIEKTLARARVLWRPITMWDSIAAHKNYSYDLIIVSNDFEGLEYKERIDRIWPFFSELPDRVMSRLRTIDCVTPVEFARKR